MAKTAKKQPKPKLVRPQKPTTEPMPPKDKPTKAQARALAKQEQRQTALNAIAACKNRETVEQAVKVLSGRPGWLTASLLSARQSLYYTILPGLIKSKSLRTRDNLAGLIALWNFIQERDVKVEDYATMEGIPLNTELIELPNGKLAFSVDGMIDKQSDGMAVRESIARMQNDLQQIMNKHWLYGMDDTPKP